MVVSCQYCLVTSWPDKEAVLRGEGLLTQWTFLYGDRSRRGGVISGWYCNVELLTAEQLTLLVIDYDWLHPVGLVFTIRGDRRGGGGGRGGGGTGGEERGDRRRGGGAQEGRRGTRGEEGTGGKGISS